MNMNDTRAARIRYVTHSSVTNFYNFYDLLWSFKMISDKLIIT